MYGLTPVKARDIIVKCFVEAQRETMFRASQRLGTKADDKQIETMVCNLVKMSFKRAGANFDEPTKMDLAEVIEILAGKAKAMGTPKDIVEFHHQMISKALAKL